MKISSFLEAFRLIFGASVPALGRGMEERWIYCHAVIFQSNKRLLSKRNNNEYLLTVAAAAAVNAVYLNAMNLDALEWIFSS